jgi:predicted NACHT family NTPase
VDSWAVLKSIESQHGLLAERAKEIYSFSHLTFHEYFTAKNILNLGHIALQELISHISEKRWKEVFLLVTEGLDNGDYFLRSMKEKIDLSIIEDPYLQQILEWVKIKSKSVLVSYKPALVRIFYLDLDGLVTSPLEVDHTMERDRILNLDQLFIRACDIALALALVRDRRRGDDRTFAFAFTKGIRSDYDRASALEQARALDIDRDLDRAITRVIARTEDLNLKHQLQSMRDQLPNRNDRKLFIHWWKLHGEEWTEDLCKIMIRCRNIGHDWQLTNEQKQKLQEYCDANLLLANCLNSECYISREVREEIEATMLLPMASIEKWKAENRPT